MHVEHTSSAVDHFGLVAWLCVLVSAWSLWLVRR